MEFCDIFQENGLFYPKIDKDLKAQVGNRKRYTWEWPTPHVEMADATRGNARRHTWRFERRVPRL